MFPSEFHIGFFPISAYGLLVTAGFFSGLITTSILAKRYEKQESRLIWDFTVTMILVALVGAKLLLIVTDSTYLSNPANIFTIEYLRSAGVFYGGFVFAALYSVWYFRKYKLPGWKIADAYGPGLALGHMFGRIGCFMAGCCHGAPTDSPLGVTFSDLQCQVPNDLLNRPLWPTQAMEAAFNLLLFGFLLLRYRRKAFDGQIVLTYALAYSLFRFLIEFLRGDERGFILPHISTSQFIALLIFPVALILYLLRRKTAAAAKG